jgi:hypothetical protein
MRRAVVWIGAGVISFVVALVIAGVGGCNVHEFGHLVAGRALGVPVDDVIWCTPTSGRIAFAYQEPALVGYAGGFLAAAVLGSLYWFVIKARLTSPVWWAAGVAVLGTTISQVIVGFWEGSSPVEYGVAQDNVAGLIALLIGPLMAAAGIQFLLQKPSLG